MARRALCTLLLALAATGCGAAGYDPRAMTCARLGHDARARTLFVDAIDNRLHARSMAPMRGLPTQADISASLHGRCARGSARDKPYGDVLDALGT